MGRVVKSLCPWLIADSDLTEANGGEPELARDCSHDGQSERHYGLLVTGSFDRSMVLGLIALRCARMRDDKGRWIETPLTLSIPDTPVTISTPRKPAMDVTLISGVRRTTPTYYPNAAGEDD